MDFFEIVEKIEKSEEFHKFKKEHPPAYLCAAFFILDYELKEEKKQLDYYISQEDVMTFVIDEKTEKISAVKAELPKKEKIEKINKEEVKLDENKAVETAKTESEIGEFSKIIAVLQCLESKIIWNLSCIKGLQMMRYHIDAIHGKVLKKEKINLMDMMKIEKGKAGKAPDYIQ